MEENINMTVDDWKCMVRDEQQLYWQCFHGYQWDTINRMDEHDGLLTLQKKIGFAMFGGPTQEKSLLGYNEEQEKQIKKFANLVYEKHKCYCDTFYISFVFVLGYVNPTSHYTEALARLPDGSLKKHLFIDSGLRVYKGWDDFLRKNYLPKSLLCYPRDGVYTATQGDVNIQFQQSVACSVGRKVLQACDITGSAVSLGSLGVGFASALALPVATPVIVGATVGSIAVGMYQMGRSIHMLTDRSRHEQSIGLKDSNARMAWMGAVTAPVGVATSGVTLAAGRILQSGRTLGLAGRIGLGTAAATSCATNVLGLANSVASVIQKACNKDHITEMDILHVAASVLFFSNAIISTRQAQQLISSMPAEEQGATSWIVTQYRKLGNVSFESVDTRKIVNYLDNDNIFCNIILPGMYFGVKCVGIPDNIIRVCGEMCALILNATKRLISGVMLPHEYLMEFITLASKLWRIIQNDFEEIIGSICQHFGVKKLQDVQLGGRYILDGVIPEQKAQLASVMRSASLEYQRKVVNSSPPQVTANEASHVAKASEKECQAAIMTVVKKSAVFQQLSTPEDLVRYTMFVSSFLHKQLEEREEEYQRALQTHKHFNPDISEEHFSSVYGITGNRYKHYLEMLMEKFSVTECQGDIFLKMMLLYDSTKHDVKKNLEELLSLSDVKLQRFSERQGQGPCGSFSDSQCLVFAEECIGRPIGHNSVTFVREGLNVLMLFNDPYLEYKTMLVAGFINEGKISGITLLTKK